MLMPVTKKPPTIDQLTAEADALLKKIGPITFEVEPTSYEDEVFDERTMEATPSLDYMQPKIVEKRKSQGFPKSPVKAAEPSVSVTYGNYVVQMGIFSIRKNALVLSEKLKESGFNVRAQKYGKYIRVFAYAQNLTDAKQLERELKNKGFEAVIRRK